MKATYKSYPSNLTTEQWIFISPYLPVAKSGQRTCPHVRPRSANLQAILDAIFYVLCYALAVLGECSEGIFPHGKQSIVTLENRD